MRTLTVVLLLVLAGACSTGTSTDKQATSRPSGAASPSAGPSDGSSSDACSEVRAGIDAFNQGDFDSTVSHFRKAVPLAEAAAARTESPEADLLVKAVRYYADLAPSDYPASSRSSREFATYKAITLGQCEGAGQEPSTPPSTESLGVTA
jgi:hypothetical protein